MFKPGDVQREKYFERIRRVKRWMRPLPRRATLHNYPVLKWFAETARKRSYLWSFKREEIIIALYVGSILTFLPLYGIQFGTGLLLAMLFRCNLMVVIALQLVSNPITVGPMWLANYYVGDFLLNFFSIDASAMHLEGIRGIEAEQGVKIGEGMKKAFQYYGAISLGGLILGYFLGFILSLIYQLAAKRYEQTHPKPALRPIDAAHDHDTRRTVPFSQEDSA